MTQSTRTARADWEARIGLRSDAEAGLELPPLAAPTSLRASAGRGQVTLDWEPVEGAAGYVVERRTAPDGPWDLLEIGEPEVRPVPHPPLHRHRRARRAGRRGTGSRRPQSVKDFDQPRSRRGRRPPRRSTATRAVEITVRAGGRDGPLSIGRGGR